MEERFLVSFIQCYFIALGVIIGGALIGSIGYFITGNPPLNAVTRVAKQLRIWAIVAAIGGTFDAIANFEKALDGSALDVFKQILIIFSAMGGVKTAMVLLSWAIQEDVG
ncbi:YtrH family sporulation protein [Virgibacillus halophilus]|uniref:YtrH family sporulation protein n=1 Tax=Tigheibacillus halophilus TaxID=361280 RepID=A0ABU5CC91_9BACI|nr:YtrH family sporulation protein [Virgibacillus halophilus]